MAIAEYGVCPTIDNQDDRQMVVTDTLTVIYSPISSKYYIKLTPKFEYGFYLSNDDEDGRQNVGRLSVCTC